MAPSLIDDFDPQITDYYPSAVQNDNLAVKPLQHAATEDGFTHPSVHFDPSVHLNFSDPSRIHTMNEMGYPSTHGVSPVAVSEPFPLFSDEAIRIMRDEILSPAVEHEYGCTSDVSSVVYLRGYAPRFAKFTYEAWSHPTTLAIISKIAGIDLVPCVDYEIAHVNTSTPAPSIEYHPDSKKRIEDGALVGWHRDSYPFVCVVMLSDTSNMVGGETAIRTASGEIRKVRGPAKGCGAVLQGRYLDHQALRAFGGEERITMVTSFRPQDPFTRDESVLLTVRPISNLSDLYGQVVEYQLENVEDRVRKMLREVRRSMKTGLVSAKAIKSFLDNEIAVLQHLNDQILEEHLVQKGCMADACMDSMKEDIM